MKTNVHPGSPSLVEVSTNNFAILTQEAGAGVIGDPVLTYRNDHTGVPITTGADTVISANVLIAISSVEIFDSSGETLELKVNTVQKLLIFPGGNDDVKSFKADVGDTIEVRAISNNAAVGELNINFFG